VNDNVCVIVAERARSELARRFKGWPVRVVTRQDTGSRVYLRAEGVPIITMETWLAVVHVITPSGYVHVAAGVSALNGAEVWFVPKSEVVGGGQ